MREWNTRYLAYAADHGHAGDPDGMLVEDQDRWPGGAMTGFMVWIRERWQEFCKVRPDTDPNYHTSAVHAAFDYWLGIRAEEGKCDARMEP